MWAELLCRSVGAKARPDVLRAAGTCRLGATHRAWCCDCSSFPSTQASATRDGSRRCCRRLKDVPQPTAENKKSPRPQRDESLRARGTTLVSLTPKNKTPRRDGGGRFGASLTLAGTGRPRSTSVTSDTLSPDNGGDPVVAYWAIPLGRRSATQLPGPFAARAGAGLSPYPGSLDPALAGTLPDHSLWREYSTSTSTCQRLVAGRQKPSPPQGLPTGKALRRGARSIRAQWR